jgi:hypothetical protein
LIPIPVTGAQGADRGPDLNDDARSLVPAAVREVIDLAVALGHVLV